MSFRFDAEGVGQATGVVVGELARGLAIQRGGLELRDLRQLTIAQHDHCDGKTLLHRGEQLEARHSARR